MLFRSCNFCHGRWHAAKQQAAAEGRDSSAVEYTPACAEACPTKAIRFGDLAKLPKPAGSVRLLEWLGTEPKIYYHVSRSSPSALAGLSTVPSAKEQNRG